MSAILRACFLVLAVTAAGTPLAAPGAAAQTEPVRGGRRATVEGVVRDAGTGEPLAGAAVVLVDLDRGALSRSDGRYALTAVPPGPQHLAVRQLGYRARTVHLLVPATGRLQLDVALEPDPLELEGVVAAPGRPVRGLDPSDATAFPDRGLTHAALRNHPTLAQADALSALAGGEVAVAPEAPAGLHVRGGAADHTGYLLDGVPVLSPYHAAGLFSAWNPDALAGLHLAAVAPSPALPDALSGTVVARTRAPTARLRMQATLSNTEARATVDGPAGVAGAGYLVGWRTGLSGALAPKDEPSYLTAETADLVATIRVPALGGVLRALVYDAENELGAASRVFEDDANDDGAPPHAFEWASRSVGAWWERPGPMAVRLGAWRAGTEAGSRWNAPDHPAALRSRRVDHGLNAVLERQAGGTRSELGLRLRRSGTAYHTRYGGSPMAWDAAGSTTVATLFAQHARPVGATVEVRGGAAASVADGRLRMAPRAEVRWRPDAALAWTAAYSRTHQFAQSLRNPESVAGRVFPADLFLGAGVSGVPVPTSDQLVLGGEWAPLPGVRLGAQAFARTIDDLLLVPPRASGPFATGAFVLGRADARGASVEVVASGARYGVVASYGWQRIRAAFGDSAYTPYHGATHTVDAGVIVFPTPTSALRVAVTGAAGRSSTALSAPFEWESCNALDQGCEFAGSPGLTGAVGGTRLPAYARVDVGGRKHWHVAVHGHDALLGTFVTLTNLLGRRNVLTYVVDPASGERQPVTMLPFSPLVVGVDARF